MSILKHFPSIFKKWPLNTNESSQKRKVKGALSLSLNIASDLSFSFIFLRFRGIAIFRTTRPPK